MTVRELFLDRNYNCAETILLWANERYGLRIAPEDVRLASGFGGGLGCGETCGALLGALSALSRALVADRAHTTPGFQEACAQLVRRFQAEMGSIRCTELKERYRRPDVRCIYVVERAAAILDDYMKTMEETRYDP